MIYVGIVFFISSEGRSLASDICRYSVFISIWANPSLVIYVGIVFLSAVRADPSLVIYVGIVFLSAGMVDPSLVIYVGIVF